MASSSWSKSVPVIFFCCTLGGCTLQFFVMKQLFVPRVEFDPQLIPEAPDYAESDAWVSLPEIVDNADLRVPGAAQPMSEVPVFFVHPTTFLDRRAWL